MSIPAGAAAGATVTFGVSPLDVWSALGTTTWDFGDGATATGTTPTHQYATAGDKTVTVSATDALGHATTRTTTLTVTATITATDPTPSDPATSTPTRSDPAAPIDLRPDRPQATLLLASHQRITTLLARRAIRTSCQLIEAGTCRVVATVDAATALRLHLRSRTLGSASARLKAGRTHVLSIALGPKLRQRLRRLDTLVVALRATTSTADHRAATTTQTLTSAR
ncbi:MAG TPA: PKD domain-containing protein [Baekduia sp.]|nr:PKD domain-containing protein [Baekduia sp.]